MLSACPPTKNRWATNGTRSIRETSVSTRYPPLLWAIRAICLVRTPDGYRVLDNRCPHQGGPLGEGHIEDGWVICPWHGFEYDPTTGAPPEGYGDFATTYPLEERGGAVFIELPTYTYRPTLMDQMVDVMTDWGVDTVFGMVGHSNLGLADALRRSEENGKLRYFGIRHEGAGAFAASAYGKLTGRPAACFSIAGPGATNLLTGLWGCQGRPGADLGSYGPGSIPGARPRCVSRDSYG